MSVQVKKHHSIEDVNQEDDLIKKQLFKGKGTDDDFRLFKSVCRHTGLNPIMKQIYPIFRKGKDHAGRETDIMTIQTSIDGCRLIADRTGRYAPGREPTFTYSETNKLISATAYVKKMTVDGTWHEVAATAFYDEFVQKFNNEPTKFWLNMEHNQLSKCAETLAIKKAFPAETAAVRSNEEMNNKITQLDGHPNIEVDEGTGQVKEVEIAPPPKLFMTREHIDEIEDILGKESEYYSCIFEFYKVASLTQIEDRKFDVILRNSKTWIKKQERDKKGTVTITGNCPSVFELGIENLKAQDLPI